MSIEKTQNKGKVILIDEPKVTTDKSSDVYEWLEENHRKVSESVKLEVSRKEGNRGIETKTGD
ncbi:hypothetical protein A3715_11385 [Oleiphilus sp. HI0009]|nr:hypothetical protein A3715_11385 [Oleiphilus sp. HI0009]